MPTSYYVETIERITEQMLVEEVLAETENIKTDAITQTDRIKDLAIDYIEKQKINVLCRHHNIRKNERQTPVLLRLHKDDLYLRIVVF